MREYVNDCAVQSVLLLVYLLKSVHKHCQQLSNPSNVFTILNNDRLGVHLPPEPRFKRGQRLRGFCGDDAVESGRNIHRHVRHRRQRLSLRRRNGLLLDQKTELPPRR